MWWMLLIAAGIVSITWFAWLLGADPLSPGNASGAANEAIQPWRLVIMLGRWIVWIAIWWQWVWLGGKMFRGGTERASAQRDQWNVMRHRMMGGIAIVEAIILFSNVTGG